MNSMPNFKSITLCLDMYGCPNRCRHCWLGVTPNGQMPIAEIEAAADAFRPFTDCLQIDSWYREPDYHDSYRQLWELCSRLSDKPPVHFELISYWRLVRDPEYVRWLSSLGLSAAQLTLFGGEQTTDFFIGRKGAYAEIQKAIDILIQNRISPRIQAFVYHGNSNELAHLETLIEQLKLEERCRAFGGKFSFFLHQGSCDGESEKLYADWVTPEDLANIPPKLAAYTLSHFNKSSLTDVFGKPEQVLYEELCEDRSTASYVADSPVFFIDKDFDVYPNISAPAPHWRLGNLKRDGAAILQGYSDSKSAAQHTRLTVPLGDIVKAGGDQTSRRLFSRDDYITLLLNRYCKSRCR